MKAVIMAGGKGTRLLPYTATFPKPLMPLGDMPIIELLLRQLKQAGVTEAYLAVNHLHNLMRAFCGDGSAFGLQIHYTLEDKPLGTAGALASVLEHMDDTFLVTNGDLLTTLDIKKMIQTHLDKKVDASIGTVERKVKIDLGILEMDKSNLLTGYVEKPSMTHHVSMGLYVLQRDAVQPHIKPSTYLDMPDLMKALIKDKRSVYCHQQTNCFWLDIGRPDDYAEAQHMFEHNRDMFLAA